ncbi:MAG TPA: hypothetical protein PKD10_14365 [Paracoccaceae bacterium]|nr:hypothetical protein [Paracoccaceae bacterium]
MDAPLDPRRQVGARAVGLIRFVLFGFFPIQFVIAGLLVWMAMTTAQTAADRSLAYAEMLAAAPPETVAVGEVPLDATPRIPDELSVVAQLSMPNNIRLIRRKNGIVTSEHLLYLLMDPEAGADETAVRAAVAIDPNHLDAFAAFLVSQSVGFGAQGPVVVLSGFQTSFSRSSHAREAIANRGLTPAAGFYFIEPFLNGREAALTHRIARGSSEDDTFYWAAAAFAALGGFNVLRALRRRGGASSVPALPPHAPVVSPPAAPGRGGGLRRILGAIVVIGVVSLFSFGAPTGRMQDAGTLTGALDAMGSIGGAMLSVALTLLGIGLVVVIWVRRGLRRLGFGGGRSARDVRPHPDRAAGSSASQPAPAAKPPLPVWAMVQRPAESAGAQPAPEPPASAPVIRSRRPDVPPVRPGFSLSRLLSGRRPRPVAQDPFERLADRIRAEREREGDPTVRLG